MVDVLPKIRVTDPQSKESTSPEKQEAGRITSPQGKGDRPLSSGKSTTKPRGNTPLSTSPTNGQPVQNGNAEARRQSEAAIDPLSRQILKRTHTQQNLPQKQRQSNENGSAMSPTSPSEAFPDTKSPIETSREITSGPNKDKKKGVSFLSRIIGNKKKGTLDGFGEDESEAGDTRPEGMDAQLFSQPIDNMGFSPRHPQPPAYIKVRTKFKKDKEFNRVFLAQELRSRGAGAEKKDAAGQTSTAPTSSGSAAHNNPIWATEFSKDGRYLAAGGQDKIVRVWAVISTSEERRAHEKEEAEGDASENQSLHLSAPVFQKKTLREYQGHTATILDLSWSKNNFLLSSSMDKTVRLWHVSRSECLCTFKHTDFVPSIQFHPRDDRFFLAGSLDTKLRLWSIPDKSVAFWNQLPDMITAVSFTPDGKTCIAGTLSGLCMFYETEGLKYQTQIHVKSTRGKNMKGSKITGIQTSLFPPGSSSGEVKLLISSNDSRVRLYNFRDKSLEVKFKGHENNCSQIRASFADDTGYIICGSEDRKAYLWSTGPPEGDKRNQRPVEMFEAHNSITTCAVLAPLKTRQLLSNSEDPIFDLCNPPPITLVSRAESVYSSRAPTDTGSVQGTPTPAESTFKRVEESPAYIARSAHTDGNIIVTADYTGSIKVFRQDCAWQKRMRASESWETSSVFSKKKSGRPSSIMSRTTGRTRRDSTSTQPPSDRILSWRQDISHGSFDSVNGMSKGKPGRSISPRKSLGQISMASSSRNLESPALGPTSTTDTLPSILTTSPKTSISEEHQPADSGTGTPPDPLSKRPSNGSNPLWVQGGQSWAFWNTKGQQSSKKLAPPDLPELQKKGSVVSALSSEEESDDSGEEDVKCRRCGGIEFKARVVRGIGGKEERKLACTKCGMPA